MKINLYTVFAAVHLGNTASSCSTECLSCYGKSSTCRAAAMKWIHDDILDKVAEAWDDNPDKTDRDVLDEAKRVFSEGNEALWVWNTCGKQYIWRLVEQEIDLSCVKDYSKED